MKFDTIIIGAGAAGLFCAAQAAKHGKEILLIDHADKIGKKILVSGGGKCNFTNLNTSPGNYLSDNPHFCISALKRYSPYDFLDLVEENKIEWYEKESGGLFSKNGSRTILDMLLKYVDEAGAEIHKNTKIDNISKDNGSFTLTTNNGQYNCQNLVIATGGKSLPKSGASGFAYHWAEKFEHNLVEQNAGLVPFILAENEMLWLEALSGVSLKAKVSIGKQSFLHQILFTHRGISGPAILQISSYWNNNEKLIIDLIPDIPSDTLFERKDKRDQVFKNYLKQILPTRLSEAWCERNNLNGKIKQKNQKELYKIENDLRNWSPKIVGTEGYRTAEVTLGGINTKEISSKTFESQRCDNLYFIGECLDVTGQLGGYNFQWAWASAYCCAQALANKT